MTRITIDSGLRERRFDDLLTAQHVLVDVLVGPGAGGQLTARTVKDLAPMELVRLASHARYVSREARKLAHDAERELGRRL